MVAVQNIRWRRFYPQQSNFTCADCLPSYICRTTFSSAQDVMCGVILPVILTVGVYTGEWVTQDKSLGLLSGHFLSQMFLLNQAANSSEGLHVKFWRNKKSPPPNRLQTDQDYSILVLQDTLSLPTHSFKFQSFLVDCQLHKCTKKIR